jgi:hypothetical protein
VKHIFTWNDSLNGRLLRVKAVIVELQRIALKPVTYHEEGYFDQMIDVGDEARVVGSGATDPKSQG